MQSNDQTKSILRETSRCLAHEKRTTGFESVSNETLLDHFKHVYPLHSKALLSSIVFLTETPTDSGAVVTMAAMIRFCYPMGFSFRISTMLGNLVYKDKFLPTEYTESLFAKVSKQLTTSLRYVSF